jgi:hypothetical protein
VQQDQEVEAFISANSTSFAPPGGSDSDICIWDTVLCPRSPHIAGPCCSFDIGIPPCSVKHCVLGTHSVQYTVSVIIFYFYDVHTWSVSGSLFLTPGVFPLMTASYISRVPYFTT